MLTHNPLHFIDEKRTFTTLFTFLFFWQLLIQSCGGDHDKKLISDQEVENHSQTIKGARLQLLEVSAKANSRELISGRVNAKNETQLFAEVRDWSSQNSISMKQE